MFRVFLFGKHVNRNPPSKRIGRRHLRRTICLQGIAAAGVLASLTAATDAAAYYWDPSGSATGTGSGGTGNWDTSDAFWYPGTAPDVVWPNTTGYTATLAGTAGTVTLTTAITTDAITFNTAGYTLSGSNTLTLGGNITTSDSGGTTTLNAPVSLKLNSVWSVGSGDVLSVGSTVGYTGTPTLTIAGAGSVSYTGSSLTSNKFVINAGGTLNFSGTASIPGGGGFTGVADGSNGTMNVTAGSFTTAANVFIGNNATGNLTVSAGTMTLNGANILLGDGYSNGGNGTGNLTVSGTGTLTTGTTAGVFYIGNPGAGVGTVNLNGGTLATNKPISKGTYSSGTGNAATFNFNGGTLQATGTSLSMNGLTAANVRNGGAVFDTQAFAVTIAQTLQHSAINGDSGTDGGLTKKGSGTLTLTGGNTYTGPTTISVGTLLAGNGTGSATGSGAVSVSGTLGDSSTGGAISGPVTVNGSAVLQGNSTAEFALGGNVSLTSGAALQFILNGLNSSSSPMVSAAAGTLTVPAATSVNLVNGSAEAPGTYYLLGYGTNTDPFSHLTLGTMPGGFTYSLVDDTSNDSVDVSVSVPEPSSAMLLGLVPLGLLIRRRRRRA